MTFQQRAQGVGLGGQRAGGETVEDEATTVVTVQLFLDQPDDDLVGDQLARVHDRGDLLAHLGPPRGHRITQHVAGGQLDHAPPLVREFTGLSALPPRARGGP